MKAHTKETQNTMTPEKALAFLKEGNARFQNNLKSNRNLLEQVNDTSDGQFPFAVILSCIDSRVSAELVFDQGLGDIFSVRIAGNFINDDILGSMEFGCKVAGSKLIVVLGHTSCGAVKGACDNVELGKLTGMLNKIKPAVNSVNGDYADKSSKNTEFVQAVSDKNVELTVQAITEQSSVLKEMVDNNEIAIVGAMYDVKSGVVTF
ncbi:MAG: carbonic anhydrase family protein [Vicingaceae bacterium]